MLCAHVRQVCQPVAGSQNALYLYVSGHLDNSKNVGERGRAVVKEFVGRRKVPLQVYWS